MINHGGWFVTSYFLVIITNAAKSVKSYTLVDDTIIVGRFYIKSVSYTHLDVYKRQVPGGQIAKFFR